MTLELNKVNSEIEEMGRVLAERAQRHSRAVPDARELLRKYAHKLDELQWLAMSHPGQNLHCAIPCHEPLTAAIPAPPMPSGATLIAVDGSQIYPDPHGMLFYYLINVGTIVFRQDSGHAPHASTHPRLFYSDDELYPDGERVSSDLVNARRAVAEMAALAALTLAETECAPACLGLTDGPLLMWLGQTEVPGKVQQQLRADYLNGLSQLKAAGSVVAGFVSRPQSAEVIALLYLRSLRPEERNTARELAETHYRGLADRMLFGLLKPGERSALFERGHRENQEYRAHGHAICFFYLNTGTDIARVEIPEWVASRPEALNLVHAAVVDQSRFNNGYPYILTRADEQAYIQGDERQVLEEMLIQAMIRQGMALPEFSRKAQQKRAARWRR